MFYSAPLLKTSDLWKYTLCGLFFLLITSLNAQTDSDIDQKIDAVYGVNYFDDKPELKKAFVELLTNRIRYEEYEQVNADKYELLSSVPLQPNVTEEQSELNLAMLNSERFNPLMYSMNFFDFNLVKVYRVDGTNTYIIIDPQH